MREVAKGCSGAGSSRRAGPRPVPARHQPARWVGSTCNECWELLVAALPVASRVAQPSWLACWMLGWLVPSRGSRA